MIALLATVVVVLILNPSAGASGLQKGSSPNDAGVGQDWFMVVDRAGILDDGQEESAINDAYRLYLEGIPTQVITENTALNQDQADFRAAELRVSHGIESAPGADDGLLLYASVDPYNLDNMVLSISAGAHALPNNGLTVATLDQVRAQVMLPQLESGHPARALVYSMREIIYLKEFTPPPVSDVQGWKSTVQTITAIFGPITGIAAAPLLWNRLRGANSRRRTIAWLAGFGVVAVILAVASVGSRSTPGIFGALLIGAAIVWQTIQLDDRRPRQSRRSIVATPRPPGTRRAARNVARVPVR